MDVWKYLFIFKTGWNEDTVLIGRMLVLALYNTHLVIQLTSYRFPRFRKTLLNRDIHRVFFLPRKITGLSRPPVDMRSYKIIKIADDLQKWHDKKSGTIVWKFWNALGSACFPIQIQETLINISRWDVRAYSYCPPQCEVNAMGLEKRYHTSTNSEGVMRFSSSASRRIPPGLRHFCTPFSWVTR